jgi:hypothetical protein
MAITTSMQRIADAAERVAKRASQAAFNSDLEATTGRKMLYGVAKRKIAKKAVAGAIGGKILGKAVPVVGAAIGAYELYKNVPQLAKDIPAYLKERKAAKESQANLKKLQEKYKGKLKTTY